MTMYYYKDGTPSPLYDEQSGAGSIDNIHALFNSIGFMSDSNGRDVPMYKGVLNAYKRAKQLIDIQWTALAAIPTNTSATGCAAGSHTGMLYSEALQFEKYVPFGCSLRTFMTAIHNPYSVMYTEDTKGTSARKKSAYGFDYLNTTLNGAFYGTVCTAFTCGALGSDVLWQSYDHAWAAENGLFVEVEDNSASGARLMDVIWSPNHCRIITDIYRDARGNPTTIYVSESIRDYVHTLQYSASELNNLLASKSGKLYRYTKLYENLGYEPSPFVAVEDETLDGEYQYNDDICTYLGDYVSIADWEKMFINYVKGSYTQMQLYKGDALIQTISLPSSYNATHSIDVTSYLNGAGEYKARLTDGTNYSDYCYFEVVDTNVTASMSGGNLIVSFSSSNASPICVKLKVLYGSVRATYVFSDKDISAGQCVFNPNKLRIAQGRPAFSEKTYARVFFRGKYNQVIGDYVDSHVY